MIGNACQLQVSSEGYILAEHGSDAVWINTDLILVHVKHMRLHTLICLLFISIYKIKFKISNAPIQTDKQWEISQFT